MITDCTDIVDTFVATSTGQKLNETKQHEKISFLFFLPFLKIKLMLSDNLKISFFILLILSVAFSFPCRAQTVSNHSNHYSTEAASTLKAVEIKSGEIIDLDGKLNEAIWQRVPAATGFTEWRPNPGEPARFKTKAYVLYTDEAIYVGARMFDPGPDSIAARLGRRDSFGYSDRFAVAFDSYNNNRTAFLFFVNPRGVQIDALLYEDTRQDNDWDAVWSAAADIDSLGWTAEMRIPFSQLGFNLPDKQKGKLIWGVTFSRNIARYSQQVAWTQLNPQEGSFVSDFGTLTGLEGLNPPTHLEIRPYIVGSLTRAPGSSSSPFYQANDLFASIGGTLEYGLTSALTLSATVNPDFGQVEADPSVVNLTAFETFFPEKRPFFLEGADIFRVRGPQLFYSRRIGAEPHGSAPRSARFADEPRRTTILGAAKLSGRTRGGWSIGVLEAVTAKEEAGYVNANGSKQTVTVEPLTNYAVARLSKNINEGQSSLGGIFTAVNRLSLPGRLSYLHTAAYTGGVDGRHRFDGGDYELSGAFYGSYVKGSTKSIARTQLSPVRYFQRPDAEYLNFDSTRTHLAGWSADLSLKKISGNWQWTINGNLRSPGFAINDIGFVRQVDEIDVNGRLFYRRYEEGRLFRRFRIGGGVGSNWTFGGERTGTYFFINTGGEFKNYWNFFFTVNHFFPALSISQLRGGPALQTDGNSNIFAGIFSDSRNSLQFEIITGYVINHGTDGYSYFIDPGLTYRPVPALELGLEAKFEFERDAAQYVTTRTSNREPVYVFGRIKQRTLSMTLRADYAFTPELSLQLYAQPFISAGEYDQFKMVANPKASRFAARYALLGDRLSYNEGTYLVDLNSNGAADLTFRDPDFNFKQLRSTFVLRWQYRRGSTLYFVWSHGQTAFAPTGRLDPFKNFGNLLSAEARNTFLLKINYWIGF